MCVHPGYDATARKARRRITTYSLSTNETPELIVTNFNRRFTGVSATANAVLAKQRQRYNARLAGYPLPDCPQVISWLSALRLSRQPPPGRRTIIWHVRRNSEMMAAIFAREIWRCPIKIVFTSAAQRLHSRIPQALIARMDAVIATTGKAASFVSNVAAIVPHGIDLDCFFPAPDRSAAWAQTGFPGRYGIATIGRVRPEKGTDFFVEAMLRLLPERPDYTALVIGHCAAKHAAFGRKLAAKVRAAGLGERVRFVGEVTASRMAALVRSLSLLVAAPRYEGFGLTPLEAMASGVALVATDTGAFSSFVEDGVSGHLVPVGDLQALAVRVATLLDAPETLVKMGMLARERAVKLFGIENEVRGIAQVYERLWAGESP